MFRVFFLSLVLIFVDGKNFPRPPQWKFRSSMSDEVESAFLNVRSSPYNAVGDGKTDDTNAFQHALNDAEAMGGAIVFAPSGNYLIETHLTVPSATVLKGVASHVQRQWGDGTSEKVFGTTLLAVADSGNENGTPFISLQGDSSGLEGLQIFYPNQVARDPPIPYPWTIRCGQKSQSIENVFVKNVLLVNSWKGIDAATYQSPRHWFENVYGQPLAIGIAVDQCYDIGRISHIHFWPFWSSEPSLWNWVNNHGITFLFERTDWEIVEDVFSWGYQTGMAFRSSSNGACNGQFSDINFDNVDIGIDISFTQPWGIFFSNLNLANADGGSNRIGILGRQMNGSKPTDTSVVIRGASFWGEFSQNLLWKNVGLISISDSLFYAWNKSFPAIEIQNGRTMISNNIFSDKIGTAVKIDVDAERATVTNNQFAGNQVEIPAKSTFLVANNLN